MFNLRVLKEEEIKELLDIEGVIQAVEEAYRLKNQDKAALFPLVFHEFEPGEADMDIKSGHLMGANIYGLKQVSWFSKNEEKNLPKLIGTIMVYDSSTGAPLGLLGAAHITSMRTGAAGSIGAKYLARKDSKNLVVVGTGSQAIFQIAATLTVMDNIEKVTIYHPFTLEKASEFAKTIKERLHEDFLSKYEPQSQSYKRLSKNFDIDFIASDNIQKSVEEADIIITATPSKKPLIKNEWVQPGTHINCIGADMEGKQEIDENIFTRAKVFVDDIKQATSVGETETPIKKGIITKEAIIGEIGDVLLGNKKGRSNDKDITIYDTTGLALQDLITAKDALKKAQERGMGVEVAL